MNGDYWPQKWEYDMVSLLLLYSHSCVVVSFLATGYLGRIATIGCKDAAYCCRCSVVCFTTASPTRLWTIDVKKRFFTFFLFWSRFFTFFNVFLFSKRFFYFQKNVIKVHSGKQINKKHFQNNSNEIDLWFMCRIELQKLAGIWTSMGSWITEYCIQ